MVASPQPLHILNPQSVSLVQEEDEREELSPEQEMADAVSGKHWFRDDRDGGGTSGTRFEFFGAFLRSIGTILRACGVCEVLSIN